MTGQHSLMSLEGAAYGAMATYLAENLRRDEAIGQVMVSVAASTLIHDVAMIALCQG